MAAGIGTGILGSHLLERTALTSSRTNLAEAISVNGGSQEQFAICFCICSVSLVGSRDVFTPDPRSGLSPAWHGGLHLYIHNVVVSRGWAVDADEATHCPKNLKWYNVYESRGDEEAVARYRMLDGRGGWIRCGLFTGLCELEQVERDYDGGDG
ncbi:hypothetical protein DSL72_003551 [Monilinia vaccinii-corymbosi]|uniref:Uncharacterized protein n=1 Tax=Monilinia vaccinii-corymbosi TaxID=61207 RepID=A0A8A3P2M4_9HELO|nr:hypothetical protein DSL72_003551 [Monilinia vaccinii-corymbosi]